MKLLTFRIGSNSKTKASPINKEKPSNKVNRNLYDEYIFLNAKKVNL